MSEDTTAPWLEQPTYNYNKGFVSVTLSPSRGGSTSLTVRVPVVLEVTNLTVRH